MLIFVKDPNNIVKVGRLQGGVQLFLQKLKKDLLDGLYRPFGTIAQILDWAKLVIFTKLKLLMDGYQDTIKVL